MLDKIILLLILLGVGVFLCSWLAYLQKNFFQPWFSSFIDSTFGRYSQQAKVVEKENSWTTKQYFAVYFVLYLFMILKMFF